MPVSRLRRLLCALLFASAPIAWGEVAFAQASDPAAAEALFAAGRASFDAGDYDSACAKFAESQRLDPAAGTLTNLAACNERRGRLASAWENWREALSLLRSDDDRRPGVEKRMAELEARLPRLVVRLAPGSPPGVQVTRDGVALGPAAFDLPLPVDPGPHRVEVVAPARAPRVYEVKAEESRLSELTVEPGAPLPAKSVTPPPPARHDEAKAVNSGNSLRLVGYVTAGVGVVGIGVGTVTGLMASGKKQTIEESCTKHGDGYTCPPEGVSASKSGKTLATVSSITMISGLALATTGVVLVLASPSGGTEVTATILPGGAAIGGRGRF
jgi:hypothetical protein